MAKDISNERFSLLTQPVPAPPLLIRMDDGKVFAYPQVAVAAVADPVSYQLAAMVTKFVVEEILGVFEHVGLVPPGTLQEYQKPVPFTQEETDAVGN